MKQQQYQEYSDHLPVHNYSQQIFNSGGAGYILNRAALDMLAENIVDNPKCEPHRKGFWEDVQVAVSAPTPTYRSLPTYQRCTLLPTYTQNLRRKCVCGGGGYTSFNVSAWPV